MRAIGIVGFKNSGKTGLTGLLATALEARGLSVAVLKCSHHGSVAAAGATATNAETRTAAAEQTSVLDRPGSDSSKLAAPGRPVAVLAENEAAVFWRGRVGLHDLLHRLAADMILVEGGKSLGCLPRLLCLHHADEAARLGPELALGTFGPVCLPSLPAFEQGDMTALAALVDDKAFLLGGLDCGLCGREDCASLARDIVAGRAAPQCPALAPTALSLKVDGRDVPLNVFSADMLAGGLRGMLSALKGVGPGTLELRLRG